MRVSVSAGVGGKVRVSGMLAFLAYAAKSAVEGCGLAYVRVRVRGRVRVRVGVGVGG